MDNVKETGLDQLRNSDKRWKERLRDKSSEDMDWAARMVAGDKMLHPYEDEDNPKMLSIDDIDENDIKYKF